MLRHKALTTASPPETKGLGKAWGQGIKKGMILALEGPLGSGKTTFVQGLAAGLSIRRKITSPTFVVMTSCLIPKTSRRFYHFDLYRLQSQSELAELGFQEIIKNKQHVVAIEWPEKAKTLLPRRTKWIRFAHDRRNPQARIIKIR